MQYSDTDFYLHQQEADQRWWLALSLALCVHAAVVLMVLFTPSLFESKAIVEEVVSVSLVAMPDAGGAAAPPPPAASEPSRPSVDKPEVPPPPPPPPPKPQALPEPVAPPESPPPTPKEKVAVQPEVAPEPVELKNPISLAPDKRKLKKAQDTRLEEEKVKEREQEQRKQEERDLQKKLEEKKREAEQRKVEERELQKKLEERKLEAERKEVQRREEERKKAIAQARLEQIKAENEARAAAAEARELAAQANAAAAAAAAVRADAGRRSQAMQSAVTGGSTGRQHAQSIVEQTYWNTVAQKVKSKWALPEMRKWDAGLLAKVVITISKTGEVTSVQFDQRSKDPLFDQLVEKTIKSAAPMPPFPALMQQESTEVGFKFLPGELGNM